MKTYTDPNEVYIVRYGDELNDTFKAKMNEMLTAANEQMQAVVAKMTGSEA